MKIGIGVQEILRFCLRNLRCCNVGKTEWNDLRIMLLRWTDVSFCTYKFQKDWFRHSEVIREGYTRGHTESKMIS
jgi:hypothetical protein